MANHITLEYPAPICDVRKFGANYLLLDNNLGLHRISEVYKKEKSFALLKTRSIDGNKHLLAGGLICFGKNDHISTFSIKEKVLNDFHWLGSDLITITASPDSRFTAAGYDNGKVNVFLKSGHIYQSLTFDVGRVNELVFDETGMMLCIVGENNKTVIHDVNLNMTLATVRTDTKILKAIFIDDNRLFAVHENGHTSLIDIKEAAVASIHNNGIVNPTALALNPMRDYGIVTEKDGKVTVIFLQRNKVLFTHRLSVKAPVKVIKWIGETLFFLFNNGKVVLYPLLNDHKRIEKEIGVKNYPAASALLKTNAFLSLFSDIEKELDRVWNEEVFPQAIDLILDGNEYEAQALAEPFLHDVYKKKVFHLYSEGSEVTESFIKAFDTRDYSAIFKTAQQYPHLKKSTKYISVNSLWENTYQKAFDVMKMGHKAKANEIFKSFNDVESKKNVISILTNFPKLFIDADALLSNRRINDYFTLVTKNPVLKETPEYDRLVDEAEAIVKEIEIAQANNSFRDIILLTKKLSLYRPYRAKAKAIMDSVKNQVLFLDNLQKGDIQAAYELLSVSHEISRMDQFKKLYAKYRQSEKEAYRAALKGNTAEILFIMRDFLKIPLLKDKIASLVKIAYINTFLKIEETHLIDWKATLEYYSLYFGIDNDIKETAKKLDIEKSLYKILGGIDKHGYRKYDFLDDIIKEKTEEQLLEEEKEGRRFHFHGFKDYLIVGMGILLFVLATMLVLDLAKSAIEGYKQDRRQGPYKLFEKVYEKTGRLQE